VAKPDTKYRALSIRSHGKGTFARVVENPASVDMETLYVAKVGDIIVNITFAWEGAIALVPPEHDGCLVSHRFPTFVPIHDKANARYLRHTLRMLALYVPARVGFPGRSWPKPGSQ
jgi:type I restriction enzyme S subunit